MGKKVLIVSTFPTHPITAGNRQFIFQQSQLLISIGYDVHFLIVLTSKVEKNKESLNLMEGYWGNRLHVYEVPFVFRRYLDIINQIRIVFNHGYYKCDDLYPYGLERFVRRLNSIYVFDCCIVNYYWLTRLFAKINFSTKAIYTHDYFSYKNLLNGNDSNTWMCTTPNEEAKGLQRCDLIFALNSEESIFFGKLAPHSIVSCIYTSIQFTNQAVVGNKNLLFLSSSNVLNVEGLKWFVDCIFPCIIEKFPDVMLTIGGSICDLDYIKSLRAYNNICIYGRVNNIDEFYSQGDVTINPTCHGTGLKIKTLEGLSFGKVVLTHPHSKIGLFKLDSAPIFASLVANDWVNYLTIIWNNPNKINEIKQKDKTYLEKLRINAMDQYERYL